MQNVAVAFLRLTETRYFRNKTVEKSDAVGVKRSLFKIIFALFLEKVGVFKEIKPVILFNP